MTPSREALTNAGLLVLLIGGALLAQRTGHVFVVTMATKAAIFALAAVGLNLVLGYGGMVSFGHAAFFGIGGYVCGILASHGMSGQPVLFGLPGSNAMPAIWPVAMVVAALAAALIGAMSLRTKGVYFIMITLAFGQMAFFLAVSLASYGGDDGMTLSGRTRLFGFEWIKRDRHFYYVVLALLGASYVLCRAMVVSRFGRVIRGARENPQRMEAVGYSLFRYQLAIYVIAGTLCGLAGFLLANQSEFVSPAYMTWQRSGELIVMVVLGGLGSLHGAIIGAAAFLLLEEWLSGITEHWKLIFGPFLILVVLFARGGMMGALKRLRGEGGGA